MKKVILLFVSIVFFLQATVFSVAASEISVSANSAILIDADTLEVLYSKAEHEKRGIASTTKILTSLIALEYGEPQRVITASKSAVTVEGTSIGLKAGDKISLLSLVYGMLLESGNDAANVTAYAISGNITEFSEVMNDYAKRIGMKNSNFSNPSGLSEENHYSTAYDMALLTSVAIKNPIFKRIASTESAVIDFGVPEVSRRLYNHNKLLSQYDGVFGVKTGYTKKSGRCLVTACEKNGVTLIAVTLNAYDDWNDHKKLYDYGFSLYSKCQNNFSLKNNKIPVVYGDKNYITYDYLYLPEISSRNDVKSKVYIEKFIYPPIKKGEIVGLVEFVDINGNILKSIPLVSKESVSSLYKENEGKLSFFEKIKKFIERLSI